MVFWKTTPEKEDVFAPVIRKEPYRAPEVDHNSVVSLIGLAGALSRFLLDRFVVASIGLVSPPPDAVNFKLSPVVEVFGRPKPLVLSYLEAT